MPRLGCREGGLDRLEVAHLTDENHVRVLAKCSAQRIGEALGVHADFTLIDDRAPIANQEFDRILDRHDVAGSIRVDVIDHSGQGCRFSRTRRARHEHQPAVLHRDGFDDLGQMQVFDRLDAKRNHPEDDSDGSALLKYVDAKTTEPSDAIGEVGFASLIETSLLGIVHDTEGHLLEFVRRNSLAVFQRDQRAVHPKHGR